MPVCRDWYEKNQFIYLCIETQPKSLPHCEIACFSSGKKRGLRINDGVFVGYLSHKSFFFAKILINRDLWFHVSALRQLLVNKRQTNKQTQGKRMKLIGYAYV